MRDLKSSQYRLRQKNGSPENGYLQKMKTVTGSVDNLMHFTTRRDVLAL